jgi:hypothetical protein
MITIVAATRAPQEQFVATTALGTSVQRLTLGNGKTQRNEKRGTSFD